MELEFKLAICMISPDMISSRIERHFRSPVIHQAGIVQSVFFS